MPFLASEAEAAGSDVVSTSAAARPACCSCRNRRSTAEPPERNASTLTPVEGSNALTILLAVSIGVDVYHTTLPSFLAASTSTASAADATPANGTSIASAARMADRLQGPV